MMKKLLGSAVVVATMFAGPAAANAAVSHSYSITPTTFNKGNNVAMMMPILKGSHTASVNKQIKAFNKQTYKAFVKDYGKSKHAAYDFGYTVLTNNNKYLSLKVTATTTAGDSASQSRYYTINKLYGRQVNMKDLFKKKDFKVMVYKAIKKQAKGTSFTSVNTKTNFYMNKHNKLVVVFDEGQIAPYSQGELQYTVNI